MQNPFKVGDKVQWIAESTEYIGWENDDGHSGDLDPSKIYTIESVNCGAPGVDYSDNWHFDVQIEEVGSWYHPAHFIRYKKTNEEKIKEREAKLCAK
jgi:hypothetical protein